MQKTKKTTLTNKSRKKKLSGRKTCDDFESKRETEMINSFAVLINVMEWTELKQQNTKTGIYGQTKQTI